VPASLRVKRLKPKTTYHYRLVATNSSGTEAGVDRTFKTAKPGSNPFRLQPSKKCVKNGRLRIRPRRPAGTRVVHLRVFVNKKKKVDRSGKSIKRLTVRGLSKRHFRLRVVGTYNDGARILSKRKYRGCTK
jgi:hypothetical protein